MGLVVPGPSPLWRLRHHRVHRGQGHRGVPKRIRLVLPLRRAARRAPTAHLAAVRNPQSQGSPLWRARRLGARGVPGLERRRACRHAFFPPRKRVARCGSRGSQSRSRARGHFGFTRLYQIRTQRPGRIQAPGLFVLLQTAYARPRVAGLCAHAHRQTVERVHYHALGRGPFLHHQRCDCRYARYGLAAPGLAR